MSTILNDCKCLNPIIPMIYFILSKYFDIEIFSESSILMVVCVIFFICLPQTT